MSLSGFRWVPCAVVAGAVSLVAGDGLAATFFGPTPYLDQTTDIPAGFYAGGSPTVLEDFEDGVLDPTIAASAGGIFGPPTANVDSVDADDGTIDGSGSAGHAYFAGGTVTFTFANPVTAAAVVWTDSTPGFETTFEAFNGAVSLGTIGPFAIADAFINGTTAEDRFFGVTDAGEITSIKLTNVGSPGIEVDHVQYGNMVVPLPAALPLMASALAGLGFVGWKRRKDA